MSEDGHTGKKKLMRAERLEAGGGGGCMRYTLSPQAAIHTLSVCLPLFQDGKNIKETHEKLKVDNVETLNCYYCHSDQGDDLQVGSLWWWCYVRAGLRESVHVVLGARGPPSDPNQGDDLQVGAGAYLL